MTNQSSPIITVFQRSPDGGRGLARDMRVRWALEEVGQHCEARPVSFAAMKEPAHKELHPFGQIPTYEEGNLALFETGAIVFHIADRHDGLLPQDADARARAIMWMFAALSTIEPTIMEREVLLHSSRKQAWFEQCLHGVEDRIRVRLNDLSLRLGQDEWLDGSFSAGDLMVADVLRRLDGSDLLDAFPSLSNYVACAEARPAFRRAYDSQRAFFHAVTAM